MLHLFVTTLVFSCLLVAPFSTPETYTLASTSSIAVSGTSTLHNWTMVMEQTHGKGIFKMEEAHFSISGLTIRLQAEALKSEHKGMDKNAYKALKTDVYPNIVFEMTHLSKVSAKGKGFQVTCEGNLTVAGTTRSISLPAFIQPNQDGRVTCSGEKAMKISDFGIEPPTALLGTIKTGDDITIAYTAHFQKSF